MSQAIYKNKYMHSLFQYIENNLLNELDSVLLSNVGHISYAQLYRDFYNLTGHTVKEYVRKRRLSNALALIKASDIGLADIAYQCGYSSHQALCRIVKKTLNLTPTEYKNSGTYYFFPSFNSEPLQSVIVSNETISRTLCVKYFNSTITNIENLAVNNFLKIVPDYNGRIFGRNGMQKGSNFCYELYLTETNRDYSKLLDIGFEVLCEIPEFTATFATSTVKNNENLINAAWNYLYSEWLQNSMFEYTNEPYYEEYILKNNKPVKLKLYLPIKKRGEETKISLIDNPKLCFIAAKAKGCNAEKTASQTVINYLKEYPHIIKISKELYMYKNKDLHVCGIRINPEIRLRADESIIRITTQQNKYLLLESNVMGDYDLYADTLFKFAKDNGMIIDKTGVFAVYDAKESFDNLSIKMYCPVKIDT